MTGNMMQSGAKKDSRPRVLDIAAYCHTMAARPLLGALQDDGETLHWLSGGADFPVIADLPADRSARFSHVLEHLGVGPENIASLKKTALSLVGAEASSCYRANFSGRAEKRYSMFLRRRDTDHAPVQFTLSDNSAFVEAEQRHRKMAKTIMGVLVTGKGSPVELLGVIKRELDALESAADASSVADKAKTLAGYADLIISTCIGILRQFENIDVKQPEAQRFSIADPAPFSWRQIVDSVEQGKIHSMEFACAADFVRNAIPLFILTPPGGEIILQLNGPAGASTHKDIPSLVKGLSVGENSIRTAADFFASLAERPSLATFAIAGSNMEARGRPLSGGGWQAMLMPSATKALDVRGFFHGFKNLLLHLQVLYVVRTPADAVEVVGKLRDVLQRIDIRLEHLREIADTGQARIKPRTETVRQWVEDARTVAQEYGKQLHVKAEPAILALAYEVMPEEIRDTFAELARNAYQLGAENITIEARKTGTRCLMISIADDGPGMSENKLAQVREVIATQRYNPNLSTRTSGTGNGLLGAAAAVSRLVDGSLSVDHGPEGRGTVFNIVLARPEAVEKSLAFV
ncbi:MAG: ATP-binding protein [Rhodospirillales bacterium]|nr:ATP-binding protein [Rhodospirillales bacterium]